MRKILHSLHQYKTIIIFSVIFAILCTLIKFTYGNGNHMSQIPIIYRVLDANYLKNDFYINVAMSTEQRLYYAKIVALFLQFLPLGLTFFILTLFSNFFTILITAFFTYKLFKSEIASLVSIFLVACIPILKIGGATFLTLNQVIPQTLTMPIILFGIALSLIYRPSLGTVIIMFGAFLHPLIGLETGVISLFAILVSDYYIRRDRFFKLRIDYILACIMLVFTAIYLLGKSKLEGVPITDEQFINILMYFRNPHHHLFQTVTYWEWIITLVFILVMFWIIKAMWQNKNIRFFLTYALTSLTLVIFLVIAGFYFTEIVPIKYIALAQTMRLFYLVKWLGIILVAGYIGTIKNPTHILISLINPFILGLYFSFLYFSNSFKRYININNSQLLIIGMQIAITLFLYETGEIASIEIYLLV